MYSVFPNILTLFYGLFCLIIFSSSANSDLVQNTSRPTYNSLCNQRPARNLQSLTREELRDFFGSFDTVITDIPAIMRQSSSPRVAVEVMKNLQKCNKRNIFLLENSLWPVQNYLTTLSKYFNFPVNESQFILPHESLLWYFKKFRMTGKAFVVGSEHFMNKLKNASIDVVPAQRYFDTNNYNRRNTMIVDPRVNKVIVELDITTNLGQLAQAGLYLKNKKTQFLMGTAQPQLYANKFEKTIGPGFMEDILINYSGRTPLNYGKPGGIMRDYIMNRYPNIASNPKKVLFIGNTLDVDMKYAYMCGFQKLWLDSDANESLVSKLANDCTTTPDYYLSDISKMSFIGCR